METHAHITIKCNRTSVIVEDKRDTRVRGVLRLPEDLWGAGWVLFAGGPSWVGLGFLSAYAFLGLVRI